MTNKSRSGIIRVLPAIVLFGLGATLQPSTLSAQCRVSGTAPADDLRMAEAACARATERFELLYGNAPPPGVVEVSDDVNYFDVEAFAPEWHLVWPSTSRTRAFLAESPPVDRTIDQAIHEQWTATLPHEIGHVLLSSEASARSEADSGPPRVPDWLHEGTAVWMEPPAYRAAEYGILAALHPYIPQHEEALSLSISTPAQRAEAGSTISRTFYPCASLEACGGRAHWSETFTVRTRQYPDGRVVVDTIFHSEPPPAPDHLIANFYAYSASLVRFLFDRGGPRAMTALLDRYVGAGDGAVSLAGLPGMPRTTMAVQREWEAWAEQWIFRR